MAQCQGPHSQIRLVFGLHLHLAGKYCENPKVPTAQLNVNLALAITWFVGVPTYCTFFNNNSPPPRQFLCNKILLKKICYSKRNAHQGRRQLQEIGGAKLKSGGQRSSPKSEGFFCRISQILTLFLPKNTNFFLPKKYRGGARKKSGGGGAIAPLPPRW